MVVFGCMLMFAISVLICVRIVCLWLLYLFIESVFWLLCCDADWGEISVEEQRKAHCASSTLDKRVASVCSLDSSGTLYDR